MSLLSHEKKIIVSLIRDAENEIINQNLIQRQGLVDLKAYSRNWPIL